MKATLRKSFPRAIRVSKLQKQVTKILAKYDIHPRNSLIAYSLCSDEIEHRVESEFSRVWGQPFMLSGLSGIPFTGPLGMDACIHHVPDDGNLFIVYGSHVGITSKGIVGKVERRGIKKPSTACGAAINAWDLIQSGEDVDTEVITGAPDGDGQEKFIYQVVNEKSDLLQKSRNPMVRLPKIIAEQIREEIANMITISKVPIVRLGGININTKDVDYFQVNEFSILYPDGTLIDLRTKF